MSVQSTCPATKDGFTLTKSRTIVYDILPFWAENSPTRLSDKCFYDIFVPIFCQYVLSTFGPEFKTVNDQLPKVRMLWCYLS